MPFYARFRCQMLAPLPAAMPRFAATLTLAAATTLTDFFFYAID